MGKVLFSRYLCESRVTRSDMGLTLVEKIAARHADGLAPGTQVRSADFRSIRPRIYMARWRHSGRRSCAPMPRAVGQLELHGGRFQRSPKYYSKEIFRRASPARMSLSPCADSSTTTRCSITRLNFWAMG